MSAKRFASRYVMIVLLTIALVGGGCATTSSAPSKPHKPQMITANGPEEVGDSEVSNKLSNGFSLSDSWAGLLEAMRPVFEILGGFANR